MKRTIFLILAFMAILIIACNNPKKTTAENSYVGAWELINSKYVSKDTSYEKTQFSVPEVKLITKKHYAFGYQAGENNVYAGGGEYAYDGSTFTTYPKYHSYSSAVGASLRWKSTLNGDLWTIYIDTLNVQRTETWKRIIE